MSLKEAGIPLSIPLHITETGWATAPERSLAKQAEVICSVIKTVHRLRDRYNITHYELFSLRDADSRNPDLFYQFGIMNDEYIPKPAFEKVKALFAELA